MNIKNTTRHHGGKPAPLIYCLQSLRGQLCGTQFLISFLNLIGELNSFIFFGTIAQIFVIIGAFRTKIHCVLCRGYTKISILSEILLLCCLCKNISYNFTRLAMFYLKNLSSKTLNVSMMNRD